MTAVVLGTRAGVVATGTAATAELRVRRTPGGAVEAGREGVNGTVSRGGSDGRASGLFVFNAPPTLAVRVLPRSTPSGTPLFALFVAALTPSAIPTTTPTNTRKMRMMIASPRLVRNQGFVGGLYGSIVYTSRWSKAAGDEKYSTRSSGGGTEWSDEEGAGCWYCSSSCARAKC
jgi:hypothetical protein